MKSQRVRRVSARELIHFTRHITTLLDVGFPPLEITRILLNQKSSPALKCAISRIVNTIHEGGSLSDGMRRSPLIFNELYTTLVDAGELTGRLPSMLKRLTVSLERAHAIRREIVAALIYPMCVVCTTAAVSSFLLIFVIPSFKDLFADLGAPLPLLTRGVLVMSEIIMTLGPWILVIVVSVGLIFSRYAVTPRGRQLVGLATLNIPVLGTLSLNASLARSCRILATALECGVPILAALSASAQAAGNMKVQRELERVRSDVAEGLSISHSLSASKLFSSLSVEMLGIGERTGSLDRALENISTDLEDDVHRRVESVKQLLEPALIAVLGVFVGGLVLAMYLPIFSMGELFN